MISKSIGAAEIGSGATPALDLASVLVSGVNIGAQGLSLNAATSTAYETSAHLVTVSVSGDVNASISKSVLILGADGLPVISYRDTTNGKLKVMRCASTACTTGVVSTTVRGAAAGSPAAAAVLPA